ncbi:DUF983 domain-containing protein [Taibaiella koreensis]|uniref:DUF983 domain-containing protein n=1 Tax=Taibaiella koreensis TaxID=1268548 RepID=UPI001F08F6EF|nr:DUF983 domain-containing protein [Taibaiella koreensis]
MNIPDSARKPGLLLSVLGNKCPRCRKGNLFTHANPYRLSKVTKMPEHCPVCGQATEVEVGFYYGTGFVSYGLSVLFSIISFLLWIGTVGISLHDNRIFWWLGSNIVATILIQPVLMRLSRSIWIAFFVKYEGTPERQAKVQAA